MERPTCAKTETEKKSNKACYAMSNAITFELLCFTWLHIQDKEETSTKVKILIVVYDFLAVYPGLQSKTPGMVENASHPSYQSTFPQFLYQNKIKMQTIGASRKFLVFKFHLSSRCKFFC